MPTNTTIMGAGIIFKVVFFSIDQIINTARPVSPITAISGFGLRILCGICAMVENKLPGSGDAPNKT